MTRAAIYARMSTDKQNERSPADQVRECRRFAERDGYDVVPELVFEEAGISGASRHNRPRLLELVARIDEWDVLLAFDFSRLARNQEDLGWIRNRLRLHRREAFEASTGLELGNIGARVMGVVNEEYLEKLRADTHRGLRGRFDRKLATGGAPFGYRTVPIVVGKDAHGRPLVDGFRLEVDSEAAAIVERLFEGYAVHGLGLRALAQQANREGLGSPRGQGWAPTAIREVLRNPIYRGERVWNRSLWVKDHETGRRVRHERPEEDWVRQRDEAWRIVSDELWEAAQTVRGRRNERHLRDGRGRILRSAAGHSAHRKRLLAGFLRCGECGGSFHALDANAWGCSWHKNRGTCANDVRVPTGVLERAVLRIIGQTLDEEVALVAVDVALDELKALLARADRTGLEEKLAAIDARIGRVLDLAAEVGDLEAAKAKLRELRGEREKIAGELAQAGRALPTLEELEPVVRARLRDLRAALTADVGLGRLSLGALLGEDRLRVYRDGRIEGTATLRPEMLWPPKANPGGHRLGRSGGTLRTETCVRIPTLRLPVSWPCAA